MNLLPSSQKNTTGNTIPAAPADAQGSNFFKDARERPVVAALALVLSIVAMMPLAWVLGAPGYRAVSTIYVSPTFIKNLATDQEQEKQYGTFVTQQVHAINRFDIVLEAVHRLQGQWKEPGESDERAAERLQSALQIQWVPDTYQIAVSLQSTKPTKSAEVVNTVVDVFLEKAKEEEFFGGNERTAALSAEQRSIQRQLAKDAGEMTDISKNLGLVSLDDTSRNNYDQILLSARESLSAARQQRIEAEAKLATAISSTSGQQDVLGLEALEVAKPDPQLDAMKAEFGHRRSALLTQMNGLSKSNPQRIGFENEIKEMDRQVAGISKSLTDTAKIGLLSRLQNDVDRTRRVEERLQADTDHQANLADKNSVNYQRASELASDQVRLRARLAQIEDRIAFLRLESSAPGFLRVFQPARDSYIPVTGGRTKYAATGLGLSLLFAFLIPYTVERNWRKITKATHVEQVIGFPPIGQLPSANSTDSEAAFAEEQFQRLITAIERSRREWDLKKVLFIAAGDSTGVGSLIERLGQALAARSLKVLILAADSNLAELGNDMSAPRLTTDSPLLLTSGESSPGRVARATLSMQRSQQRLPLGAELTRMLRVLSDPHDIVLITSPALNVSAETELLAGVTDATILTVESGAVDKSHLEKAARWLERLRVPAIGVVLTKVRMRDGGLSFRQSYSEFRAAISKLDLQIRRA